MIKIILSFFFFAQLYANDIVAPPHVSKISFRAMLQTEKGANDSKFLGIINEEFVKGSDVFEFELKNNGYTCSVKQFDILFLNTSEDVRKLFVSGNEEIVRGASESFIQRLISAMDETSGIFCRQKMVPNFKYINGYFTTAKNKFFSLDSKNAHNQKEQNQSLNEEEMKQSIESGHNSLSEPSVEIEEISDLSKVENTGEDSEQMTKEKALNILMNNSFVRIRGECSRDVPEENDMIVKFKSTFGDGGSYISTICKSENKSYLRKNSEEKQITVNNQSMKEIISRLNKLLESIFGKNNELPSLLNALNSNSVGAMGNLESFLGEDIETTVNEADEGNDNPIGNENPTANPTEVQS